MIWARVTRKSAYRITIKDVIGPAVSESESDQRYLYFTSLTYSKHANSYLAELKRSDQGPYAKLLYCLYWIPGRHKVCPDDWSDHNCSSVFTKLYAVSSTYLATFGI